MPLPPFPNKRRRVLDDVPGRRRSHGATVILSHARSPEDTSDRRSSLGGHSPPTEAEKELPGRWSSTTTDPVNSQNKTDVDREPPLLWEIPQLLYEHSKVYLTGRYRRVCSSSVNSSSGLRNSTLRLRDTVDPCAATCPKRPRPSTASADNLVFKKRRIMCGSCRRTYAVVSEWLSSTRDYGEKYFHERHPCGARSVSTDKSLENEPVNGVVFTCACDKSHNGIYTKGDSQSVSTILFYDSLQSQTREDATENSTRSVADQSDSGWSLDDHHNILDDCSSRLPMLHMEGQTTDQPSEDTHQNSWHGWLFSRSDTGRSASDWRGDSGIEGWAGSSSQVNVNHTQFPILHHEREYSPLHGKSIEPLGTSGPTTESRASDMNPWHVLQLIENTNRLSTFFFRQTNQNITFMGIPISSPKSRRLLVFSLFINLLCLTLWMYMLAASKGSAITYEIAYYDQDILIFFSTTAAIASVVAPLAGYLGIRMKEAGILVISKMALGCLVASAITTWACTFAYFWHAVAELVMKQADLEKHQNNFWLIDPRTFSLLDVRNIFQEVSREVIQAYVDPVHGHTMWANQTPATSSPTTSQVKPPWLLDDGDANSTSYVWPDEICGAMGMVLGKDAVTCTVYSNDKKINQTTEAAEAHTTWRLLAEIRTYFASMFAIQDGSRRTTKEQNLRTANPSSKKPTDVEISTRTPATSTDLEITGLEITSLERSTSSDSVNIARIPTPNPKVSSEGTVSDSSIHHPQLTSTPRATPLTEPAEHEEASQSHLAVNQYDGSVSGQRTEDRANKTQLTRGVRSSNMTLQSRRNKKVQTTISLQTQCATNGVETTVPRVPPTSASLQSTATAAIASIQSSTSPLMMDSERTEIISHRGKRVLFSKSLTLEIADPYQCSIWSSTTTVSSLSPDPNDIYGNPPYMEAIPVLFATSMFLASAGASILQTPSKCISSEGMLDVWAQSLFADTELRSNTRALWKYFNVDILRDVLPDDNGIARLTINLMMLSMDIKPPVKDRKPEWHAFNELWAGFKDTCSNSASYPVSCELNYDAEKIDYDTGTEKMRTLLYVLWFLLAHCTLAEDGKFLATAVVKRAAKATVHKWMSRHLALCGGEVDPEELHPAAVTVVMTTITLLLSLLLQSLVLSTLQSVKDEHVYSRILHPVDAVQPIRPLMSSHIHGRGDCESTTTNAETISLWAEAGHGVKDNRRTRTVTSHWYG